MEWVVFGKYKWTKACAEIARQYHCGDLHQILRTRYAAYRHNV